MKPANTYSARQLAFQAINDSLKGERYVAQTIQKARENGFDPKELSLAFEIASGAIRFAKRIDWVAEQAANKKKIKLKRKEKALLRLALYQLLFLNSIPNHAAVNESVKIAKQVCHPRFVSFLNALCRKIIASPVEISKDQLDLYYSYPSIFVEMLLCSYGWDQTIEILKAGNQKPTTWIRKRDNTPLPKGVQDCTDAPEHSAKVVDSTILPSLTNNPSYYIQNVTQAHIFHQILQRIPKQPKDILDLCAAPGGKTIFLSDYFPLSNITSNDINKNKIDLLKENCKKYHLCPNITCYKGESYPKKQLFDLVVVDAPCSNSGVFSKRAEARWRYNEKNIDQLVETQKKLLQQAEKLTKDTGHILYTTCSICPRENDAIMKGKDLIGEPVFVLPNHNGWDGGFGALYKPVKNISI